MLKCSVLLDQLQHAEKGTCTTVLLLTWCVRHRLLQACLHDTGFFLSKAFLLSVGVGPGIQRVWQYQARKSCAADFNIE